MFDPIAMGASTDEQHALDQFLDEQEAEIRKRLQTDACEALVDDFEALFDVLRALGRRKATVADCYERLQKAGIIDDPLTWAQCVLDFVHASTELVAEEARPELLLELRAIRRAAMDILTSERRTRSGSVLAGRSARRLVHDMRTVHQTLSLGLSILLDTKGPPPQPLLERMMRAHHEMALLMNLSVLETELARSENGSLEAVDAAELSSNVLHAIQLEQPPSLAPGRLSTQPRLLQMTLRVLIHAAALKAERGILRAFEGVAEPAGYRIEVTVPGFDHAPELIADPSSREVVDLALQRLAATRLAPRSSDEGTVFGWAFPRSAAHHA